MTKRCSHCHEDKPLSAYGVERRTKDGLKADCKVCHNKRGLAYRRQVRKAKGRASSPLGV